MMKQILVALALTLPLPAFAITECAGETFKGAIINVKVFQRNDTILNQRNAEVTITEKNGAQRSYLVKDKDISQFFESVDGEPQRAIVGLTAFVNGDAPVEIRYVGENYQGDLTKVLRDEQRVKQERNALRVWKGPGFTSDQQHNFADVVCSVSVDL